MWPRGCTERPPREARRIKNGEKVLPLLASSFQSQLCPPRAPGRWEAFPELWTFAPSTALGQQEAPGSMWLWVGIPSCRPSPLMLIIKPASRLPPSLPPSLPLSYPGHNPLFHVGGRRGLSWFRMVAQAPVLIKARTSSSPSTGLSLLPKWPRAPGLSLPSKCQYRGSWKVQRAHVRSLWVWRVLPGPVPQALGATVRTSAGVTVGVPWPASTVVVCGHIMCPAIYPTCTSVLGWEGLGGLMRASAQALSLAPLLTLVLTSSHLLSSLGARDPQRDLLSSTYLGTGLANPRAREWTVRGWVLPFPQGSVPSGICLTVQRSLRPRCPPLTFCTELGPLPSHWLP